MQHLRWILLLYPLLFQSCATVEKDVRISVRDAETKAAVDNGLLIFDRPNFTSWYFSLDPVRSQKYTIDSNGTAVIDELKDVVWSMKAEVEGYDRAVSVFSLPELTQMGAGDWRKMGNERSSHPNFPGKFLEYRVESAQGTD